MPNVMIAEDDIAEWSQFDKPNGLEKAGLERFSDVLMWDDRQLFEKMASDG